jgi:hypothetical protein
VGFSRKRGSEEESFDVGCHLPILAIAKNDGRLRSGSGEARISAARVGTRER